MLVTSELAVLCIELRDSKESTDTALSGKLPESMMSAGASERIGVVRTCS